MVNSGHYLSGQGEYNINVPHELTILQRQGSKVAKWGVGQPQVHPTIAKNIFMISQKKSFWDYTCFMPKFLQSKESDWKNQPCNKFKVRCFKRMSRPDVARQQTPAKPHGNWRWKVILSPSTRWQRKVQAGTQKITRDRRDLSSQSIIYSKWKSSRSSSLQSSTSPLDLSSSVCTLG